MPEDDQASMPEDVAEQCERMRVTRRACQRGCSRAVWAHAGDQASMPEIAGSWLLALLFALCFWLILISILPFEFKLCFALRSRSHFSWSPSAISACYDNSSQQPPATQTHGALSFVFVGKCIPVHKHNVILLCLVPTWTPTQIAHVFGGVLWTCVVLMSHSKHAHKPTLMSWDNSTTITLRSKNYIPQVTFLLLVSYLLFSAAFVRLLWQTKWASRLHSTQWFQWFNKKAKERKFSQEDEKNACIESDANERGGGASKWKALNMLCVTTHRPIIRPAFLYAWIR